MTEASIVAGEAARATSSPDSRPRSRVQFSDDQGSSGVEALPRASRAGASSPHSRKSAQTTQNAADGDARRRVRSLGGKSLLSETSPFGSSQSKRAVEMVRGSLRDTFGFGQDPALDGFGPGALSDEYDLYPKILKDVQHALKLKARREARLQGLPSSSPPNEITLRPSTSSEPSGSSSGQITFPPPPPKPHQVLNTSKNSEIDFSPSTAITPIHPVPVSSNGGATLDWTGPVSDDEKKWTLSMGRVKSKDKLPLAGKAIVEKQNSLFADKINRIRAEAKPQTLRKVAITTDQLQRRYDIVYKSLNGPNRINPVGAAHWYTASGSDLQASLDEAEQLTWLKHLLDKKERKSTVRSPWQLSALVVEEYARSQTRPEMMETILEDPTAISPSNSQQNVTTSPYSARSRPSSHASFSPLTPRRLSDEGHVSFEPFIESTRTSLEGEPRRSSDKHLRAWRLSLPGVVDSPHSSLYSSNLSVSSTTPNQHRPDLSSLPSGSRPHIRDLANRIRRRPYVSDDGSSSARNSQSEEQSRSDDGNLKRRRSSRNPRMADLALTPASRSGNHVEHVVHSLPASDADADYSLDADIEVPLTVKAQHATLKDDEELVTMMAQDSGPEISGITKALAVPVRKGVRMSLPPPQFFEEPKRHHHYHEVDEEKERYEYEHKAQLLDDTITRNQRIRQTLQHLSAGVREYDFLQTNLRKLLGVPQKSMPAELLDAFNHDPAAVTGATRKFTGWRAVEDIHDRITRQREAVRAFLTSEDNGFVIQNSVFDAPIATLEQTLGQLEDHRKTTAAKARDVAGILTRVKGIHASAKTEYNDTLSHTSVVYPELSQIIALEESYKDQYQHLWELGMDTLTLLLDTVTPVWRNYGKMIGEDVQDFLIIPLYRNEFTGETKRYPVQRFPKRSFRHWLGLILFFIIAIAVTLLQCRATIFFISYYRLPWNALDGIRWAVMPFFWIAVFIQICAVLIELAIVFAQLGVVAWWFGWLLKIFT